MQGIDNPLKVDTEEEQSWGVKVLRPGFGKTAPTEDTVPGTGETVPERGDSVHGTGKTVRGVRDNDSKPRNPEPGINEGISTLGMLPSLKDNPTSQAEDGNNRRRVKWQEDTLPEPNRAIIGDSRDTLPLVENIVPTAENQPSGSNGGRKKKVQWQEDPLDENAERTDRKKSKRRHKKRNMTPFSSPVSPMVAPLDEPAVPKPPPPALQEEDMHEEPVNRRRPSDG